MMVFARSEPDLAQRFGENGRNRVEKEFSFEAFSRQFNAVVDIAR